MSQWKPGDHAVIHNPRTPQHGRHVWLRAPIDSAGVWEVATTPGGMASESVNATSLQRPPVKFDESSS